jgi:hypothetical protein
MRDTFRFGEETDVDLVSFHVVTHLPKTKMYEIASGRGLFAERL